MSRSSKNLSEVEQLPDFSRTNIDNITISSINDFPPDTLAEFAVQQGKENKYKGSRERKKERKT